MGRSLSISYIALSLANGRAVQPKAFAAYCGAGGRLEPQSNCNGGLRALDQQCSLGAKDSVANVSQIVTLDKELLTELVGKLPRAKLELVFAGIDVVLGAGLRR